MLYDVKGRFICHPISQDEATYKLAKVRKIAVGQHSIPYCVTHDARTIRYPDPAIQANDSVVVDLKTGKITDSIKFDTGNTVMVIGGRNTGRIGTITHRERHASKCLYESLQKLKTLPSSQYCRYGTSKESDELVLEIYI